MAANWDTISFVKGSPHRIKLLDLLETPKTPTELHKGLGISLSHTSQLIRQLQDRSLIECLSPQRTKARLYKRTELGTDALTQARQL